MPSISSAPLPHRDAIVPEAAAPELPITGDDARPLSGIFPSSERYVLGDILGEGATSTVYEAHDLLLDRIVAVKQLKGVSIALGTALLGEAQALAAVDHPSVVRVISVEPESTPPFLVMDRAPGRPLASILTDGRLPVPRALKILQQIAAGTDALHASGIVHGDLKPSNVLVGEGDVAKIIDVGLSPFLARMRPGEQLGTPSYMPPERAMGANTPGALLPRGDVYSFAVVCFQLLTGSLPFVTSSATEMLEAHAARRPLAPSAVAGLSTEFDAPIARALSKRPDHRPSTCTELVEALTRASLGADVWGRRLRILIADDDSDQQRLLTAVLGAHLPGAGITHCTDGYRVLEAMRGLPMSLALLDLTMPGPCGIALARQVRDRSPTTAIVILTGAGSGAERAGARALGIRNFVVKPFEIDELMRAIASARADVEAVELARGKYELEAAKSRETARMARVQAPKVIEMEAPDLKDRRRE
jgi:CheY-like chemotaxis protein